MCPFKMMVGPKNADFLNEVIICDEVSHQPSPSELERVPREDLVVPIRGDIKLL